MDDQEDSRTASVGRKRGREELQEGYAEGYDAGDTQEKAQKRPKRDEINDQDSMEDGEVAEVAPEASIPSTEAQEHPVSLAEPSHPQEHFSSLPLQADSTLGAISPPTVEELAQQQADQGSTLLSWNKGVQSNNVRTSFGARLKARTPLITTPKDEATPSQVMSSSKTKDACSVLDPALLGEKTDSISPNLEIVFGQPSYIPVSGNGGQAEAKPQVATADVHLPKPNDPEAQAHGLQQETKGSRAETGEEHPLKALYLKRKMQKLQREVATQEQKPANLSAPSLLPVEDEHSKGTAVSMPNSITQNSGSSSVDLDRPQYPKAISKKMDNPKYRYECGAGTLRLELMEKDGHPISIQDLKYEDFLPHMLSVNPGVRLKHKQYVKAFAQYCRAHYSTTINTGGAALRDAAVARAHYVPETFTKHLLQQQSASKSTVTPNPIADQSQASITCPTEHNIQEQPSEEEPHSQGVDEDVRMVDIPRSCDVSQMQEMVVDPEYSERERVLQEKYFWSVDGMASKMRCLSCAETTHTTMNCPALACTLCNGDHTSSQCIQNQSCGKCRQKGHRTIDCKEKLLPSRSELVCDICSSDNHLEQACHLIWRTYFPKPEEISPRDLFVYCYFCGSEGHYGRECGLNNTPSLSGGQTWSSSSRNLYAVPSNGPAPPDRRKRDFSIKGKANDPITLDDSDEDVAFIRPRIVNPPITRKRDYGPGSGQQVGYEQYVKAPPPESYYNSFDRSNAPGTTQHASNYGPPGVFDSARYGRERPFSPPPPPQAALNLSQAPASDAIFGQHGNGKGPPPRGSSGNSRGRGGSKSNSSAASNSSRKGNAAGKQAGKQTGNPKPKKKKKTSQKA